MSGRGRHNNRGGRGRGRGRGRSTSTNNTKRNTTVPKERKVLSDYIYYIGSAYKASDYTLITSYIINHIRKTYGGDIADALEQKRDFDFTPEMPILQTSATPLDTTDTAMTAASQAIIDRETTNSLRSCMRQKYKSSW